MSLNAAADKFVKINEAAVIRGRGTQDTGDGRINVDFPIVSTGKVGRSELRGKMNGGGPVLTARTGDGSINILKY